MEKSDITLNVSNIFTAIFDLGFDTIEEHN